MKAFHGKEEVKEKYLARVRAHRLADEIVKGTYWTNGKGCAVGCTIHSGNHRAYETELGIPELIARLEDGIFERLPNEMAMQWPERFLSIIQVGADLSKVGPQFMIWMLSDEKEGIIRGVENEEVKAAVMTVVELYKKKLNGIEITDADWSAALAALAARAALAALDARAARAALDARAARAALAALDALDARAARDALTPEQYEVYENAKTKMYIRMSDKLLELLAEAKPLEMVGSI